MSTLNEAMLTDLLHDGDLEKSASGDLITITGLDNIEQALFHRLLTTPGSLVHRPTYGIGIKDFQNAVNSLDNQRIIANRIFEQFQRDPRIKSIDGVKITVDDATPEMTTIFVKATVVGYDEQVFEFKPFGDDL